MSDEYGEQKALRRGRAWRRGVTGLQLVGPARRGRCPNCAEPGKPRHTRCRANGQIGLARSLPASFATLRTDRRRPGVRLLS
ncbi:hypothetical protein YT1_4257 [Rhodococcus ruber]|nr:hypothetical protein YT1_4257 [Rhodococcus ruber]